jgi:hypothetical protein
MAHEFEFQGSDSQDDIRPNFHIGQHDSTRYETLSHLQYGQILNSGVSSLFSSFSLSLFPQCFAI